MPGRVLVVDGLATNRIILKVKLSAARYDVIPAENLERAILAVGKRAPDLVILGVADRPDGPERVQRLRETPILSQSPILVICDGADPALRLALLDAGADDILTNPIDETYLIARMRSTLRSHDRAQELRLRDTTTRALGLAEAPAAFERPAAVSIISHDADLARDWAAALEARIAVRVHATSPDARFDHLDAPDPEAIVIAEAGASNSANSTVLLPDLRTRGGTRHAAILPVLTDGGRARAGMALDLGASDVLLGPPDMDELAFRLRRQIKAKRDSDRLRETVQTGLEMAVTDPLTGLYNRRYAMSHLARVCEQARTTGRQFAVMVADLDRFKLVNDTYGHPAGDAVLIDVAERLRQNLRAVDLVARFGGEEFLVVMPDTGLKDAHAAAKRLCHVMKSRPVDVAETEHGIHVTVSIGLAIGPGDDPAKNEPQDLIARADKALYASKAEGRNQVTVSRSAA